MINRYNACPYNTSVMLRKIYCTYFLHLQHLYMYKVRERCWVPLARRCHGKRAGRGGDPPRLSASQIVIYRNDRNESGLIHHDFSLPRGEKSSTRSLLPAIPLFATRVDTSDTSPRINARDTHIKKK